jgi:hypothetical protein
VSDETAIEVEQTPEPEAPARPEWLPENFKDEAAFAASYKEAERKIREQGEKLRELEERDQEWREWAQQVQRPAATDPAQQITEIWDDPDRQPLLILEMAQRMAALETQLQQAASRGPDPTVTQITADYAENRMRAQHEDWDTYRDQIAELVQNNPHLLGTGDSMTLEQATSGLELAYRAVKGHVLSTTAGQAASDAAEAARLAKEQAQTMSGGSSRPATQTAEEEYWAAVRAASSGSYGDS